MKALDPRSRLMVVFVLTSLALFNHNYYLTIVLLMALVVAVHLFGGNFGVMRSIFRYSWIFIILMFVQSFFTQGGVVLLQIGNVHLLSSVGIERAYGFFCRFTVVVLSATILMAINPREMVQSFIQCKVPYEIAFMVQLAIRFLPLLREELHDSLVAIQLRGVQLECIPLQKRLQVYSYLFLPVLVGVISKAKEISTAIEMRGFRASSRRTTYIALCFTSIDYFVITGVGLFFIMFILLQVRF